MLRQMIRRYASALTRSGFRKGEIMAIVSPNVPEYPVAMLGATGAGMPVALVNPTYTPGLFPIKSILLIQMKDKNKFLK